MLLGTRPAWDTPVAHEQRNSGRRRTHLFKSEHVEIFPVLPFSDLDLFRRTRSRLAEPRNLSLLDVRVIGHEGFTKAGMRIGFGCRCHALARRLRSSANKWWSWAQEAASAKPSNLPSRAMRLAARMKPPQAARASPQPRLMRRTPSAATSATVSPIGAPITRLTGLGATAVTMAAICSRVLMPGA